MQAKVSIDFNSIAANYNLLDYISGDLGAPALSTGGTHKWCCPFHSEGTPSFVVYGQRWHCFGACNEDGGIFDYIMKREGVSLITALERLQGSIMPQTPIAPRVRHSTQQISVSYEQVAQYALNNKRVKPYAASRGVSEKTVEDYLWGETDEWSNYVINDEKFDFTHPRYVIPYWSGKTVKCITKRRDEDLCRKLIEKQSPDLIQAIKQDYLTRTNGRIKTIEDLNNSVMIDLLFGGKYRKSKGAQFPIYNINLLYELDDSGELVIKDDLPVPARRPYMIVCEGEIDAQSLCDHGYYAIATKGDSLSALEFPFRGVINPIVLADNDDAGVAHAMRVHKLIGRGQILRPLDGFKDANDLVVGRKVDEWARRYGIPQALPVLI